MDRVRPILVTGASGFIGSRIVDALARAGNDVVGVARSIPPVDIRMIDRRVRLDSVDLCAPAAVARLVKTVRPRACIHAAWYVNPVDYRTSHENARWANASIALFTQLIDAGCEWIGGLGSVIERFADETPYAIAKRTVATHGRSLVMTAGDPRPRFAWFRVHQVYGPGEHGARLVPSLIAARRSGRHIKIANARAVRDFVHVDDVAEALARAYRNRVDGTFDVGTGIGHTVGEVDRVVSESVDAGDRRNAPRAVDSASTWVADPTPLLRAADWSATIDLATGLADLIDRTGASRAPQPTTATGHRS